MHVGIKKSTVLKCVVEIIENTMNNNNNEEPDLDALRKKFTPKKPKITVSADFLDNAKSYEDKQALVQILAEKEKNRMILIVKAMLKDAVNNSNKK